METVYIGVDNFANPASAEDDLGGGLMYAALIKQAVLKRRGLADADILTHIDGLKRRSASLGAVGAVIADTSDRSNIPMQIVCPTEFKANLITRIQAAAGVMMPNCPIGTFLDAFMAECDSETVPAWDTFARWFNNYRSYLNDSIVSASVRFETIDGYTFAGTVHQIPEITKLSDIITWTKSMMPDAMLIEETEKIISDTNPDKIGFSETMTGMTGIYPSLTGKTTAIMRFFFRL